MTEREDHVIISDAHYCPLGVELTEEGEETPGGGASETQVGVAAPADGGVASPPPSVDPAPGEGDGAPLTTDYPKEDVPREHMGKRSDHAHMEPLSHAHKEKPGHAHMEPLSHAHKETPGHAHMEQVAGGVASAEVRQ